MAEPTEVTEAQCATCLAAIHLHSGGRVWMHDEPTAGVPYHAASPLPMPPLALS